MESEGISHIAHSIAPFDRSELCFFAINRISNNTKSVPNVQQFMIEITKYPSIKKYNNYINAVLNNSKPYFEKKVRPKCKV